MPTKKQRKVCSPAQAKCVRDEIYYVKTTAYDPNGPLQKCKCSPACSEMEFPFTMSQGKLDKPELLTDLGLPDEFNDSTYVTENLAVVHIYHENIHFLKHERGEVRNEHLFIKVEPNNLSFSFLALWTYCLM